MKWLLITLLIITVIIILPIFIYGYWYPNASDDTAMHLKYFENMSIMPSLYGGQYVTGVILNALPLDLDTSFFWFNYIAYVSFIWLIGFISYKVSGKEVAILSVLLSAFGILAMTNLFMYGQIFDLIGMGLLILGTYFASRIEEGFKWEVLMILTLVPCLIFHANGAYVLPLILIVFVYEFIYKSVTLKTKGIINEFLSNRFMVYSTVLAAILYILHLFGVGQPDPNRLVSDAEVLIVFPVAWLLYQFMLIDKKVKVASIITLSVFVLIGVSVWLQDNSAVKEVDKQAIVYVNRLSENSYSVEDSIAPWIYDRFIDKEYIEYPEVGDIVITRSKPMTPLTDSNNANFYYNRIPDYSKRVMPFYNNSKSFEYKGIKIDVYTK